MSLFKTIINQPMNIFSLYSVKRKGRGGGGIMKHGEQLYNNKLSKFCKYSTSKSAGKFAQESKYVAFFWK